MIPSFVRFKSIRACFILFLFVLVGCSSPNDANQNRLQAIQKEMDEVKAVYFKKVDSLEVLKKKDTSAIAQQKINEAITKADNEKSAALIQLTRESDSLITTMKK